MAKFVSHDDNQHAETHESSKEMLALMIQHFA